MAATRRSNLLRSASELRSRLTRGKAFELAASEAAERVAQISSRLGKQLRGLATVELLEQPGRIADLTVSPVNPSAVTISIVGSGRGFILRLNDEIREIEDNAAGRKELEALIEDAIAGQIEGSQGGQNLSAYYPPYK